MGRSRAFLGGIVLLYFIIGLEILIMISPFAAFFYSAFNPFLLSMAQHASTRWLTAFFLPHMIAPSGVILKGIRVAGSVLFVLGFVIFFVCAGQVYFNKFARRGVAMKGLYSLIRHPQYLGLGLAGAGLAVLWPRMLTAALLPVMLVVYYVLAKDEERRVLRQHEAEYRRVMDTTGMFFPKRFENMIARLPLPKTGVRRTGLLFVVLASFSVGGAFLLRSYTVSTLPLWTDGPVTAVSILPAERFMLEHRMPAVLEISEIKARLAKSGEPYLVYFMRPDYIMQGMIADTGGRWKLFEHHRTFAMIVDWIFHPFRHLEGGHAGMAHHGMMTAGSAPGDAMTRRLIFLRVETGVGHPTPRDLFAINALRTPVFVADVNVHTAELLEIRDLPVETGWGRVPTPIF
jgi:protein-S-isoprenylcysteine O-methyltransferase Ste14